MFLRFDNYKVATLFLSLLIFLSLIVDGQSVNSGVFILTGRIENQKSGAVSLTLIGNDRVSKVYTSTLRNGAFRIKGYLPSPLMAVLRGNTRSISDDDPNAVSFFLSPGCIRIEMKKDEFKNAKVSGSKSQVENEELLHKFKQVENKKEAGIFDSISINFIRNHPSSVVSAFELRLQGSRWPVDTVCALFNSLYPNVQNSTYGNDISEEIERTRSSFAGKIAKPFSANNIHGEPISLSDFHGKYVLLDFWASWCVPCRAQNPQLIELYMKYHRKGLEIISIADDDIDTTAWRNAIEKDGTGIWHQILRNYNEKLPERDISTQYGIASIPAYVLVGPDGTIVFNSKQDKQKLSIILGNIFRE